MILGKSGTGKSTSIKSLDPKETVIINPLGKKLPFKGSSSLYSNVKFDDKGVPTYGFYTHRCMEGSTVIPAKSPADMFTEDFIPNDLGLVVKAMNEYYN